MSLYTSAFSREERRAYYYKKLYQQHVKVLFNLPAHPKSDNIDYEGQFTHHDVFAINAEGQKDGILVSFHPLIGPVKVQVYKDGELLCDLDTMALMQLVIN